MFAHKHRGVQVVEEIAADLGQLSHDLRQHRRMTRSRDQHVDRPRLTYPPSILCANARGIAIQSAPFT